MHSKNILAIKLEQDKAIKEICQKLINRALFEVVLCLQYDISVYIPFCNIKRLRVFRARKYCVFLLSLFSREYVKEYKLEYFRFKKFGRKGQKKKKNRIF